MAAIIASTSAPVALAASADVWLIGEQDNLTRLVLSDASLDDNGVDITLEAALAPEPLAIADRQLTDETSRTSALGEVSRTVYTLPGLLAIAPEGPGQSVRSVGPAGRLFARDGALENIDVVDQLDDVARGVWITTSFAERHELALGDGIGFEAGAIVDEQWNDIVQGGGARSVFRIVGTYEPLWEKPVNAYWSQVPAELVPRFLAAGVGPSSELVIAAESTVLDSGLTGVARWSAPLTRWPDDFVGLGALERRIDQLEDRLIGSGPLAESMLALSTTAQASPRLSSEIGETASSVRGAANQLVAPLGTARRVGTIVGVLAMAAVGIFFIERNRVAFRLLIGEGAGTAQLAMRTSAMLLAPAAVGAMLGVVAAPFVVARVGPASPPGIDGVDVMMAVQVAGASLVLTSVVAGAWAVSATRPLSRETLRAIAISFSLGVMALAVLMWLQVGRTRAADRNTVDLAIVVLPLAVTAAGLVAVLAIIAAVGSAAAHRADRLPTLGLLTIARVATSGASLRITSLVLGLGVGLVVFAAAFVGTLGRAVDLKLASEIGGASRVQIIDRLPADALSEASTVVKEFDTALTGSGQRIKVLAIDPATFATAVDWPEEFGLDAASVVELLERSVADRVAAVAVTGQGMPVESAFGFSQSFPYELVGRVQALPASAAGRATLLVRADALDALGLERAGFETIEDTVGTAYRPPTDRFRRVVISRQPIDALLLQLDELGIRTRDPASQAGRRDAPDLVAARSAFGYLGVLGAAGAVGATGALMASLAARRRQRSLSAVMLRSMGFSAGRSATATVLEVGGLVVTLTATAAVTAPLTVGRVAERFDPSPGRPPATSLDVPWFQLAAGTAGAVAAIGVLLWLVEWRSGRRLPAEVLNEG